MSEQYLNALPIGSMVDVYRIEQVLGVGGFGIVYKALHTKWNTYVALKEYLPADLATRRYGATVSVLATLSTDLFQSGLECFEREASTLSKINHHNIVRVMHSFSANNTSYIVMDFVRGETLSEKIKSNQVNRQHVEQWLIALLQALSVLHQQGILHRDITPNNIMINEHNQPVLIDFGSVLYFIAERSRTIQSIVSAPYTPIELYGAESTVYPCSDLYALGQTFYEVVSGDKAVNAIRRIQGVDPQPELSDRKNLSMYGKSFILALDRATRTDQKKRFKSAEEWLEFISGGSKKQTEKPATTKEPKKHLKLVAIVLSLCLVAWGADQINWHQVVVTDHAVQSWFDDAVAAEASQSYLKAAELYRKAAEQNHAAAQNKLGEMYQEGRGVEQSDVEAVNWYRKAAEQNDASAQNNLGEMYFYNSGVKQSDTEAVNWYRKAAEQNLADAQIKLGWMYFFGRGVEQSDTEAVNWYRKAAEQNLADAQIKLGWMYEEGRGVKQSDTKAVKWYRKAAEQNDADAQNKLSWLAEQGRIR